MLFFFSPQLRDAQRRCNELSEKLELYATVHRIDIARLQFSPDIRAELAAEQVKKKNLSTEVSKSQSCCDSSLPTSAWISFSSSETRIRHTSAYVSIRQHKSQSSCDCSLPTSARSLQLSRAGTKVSNIAGEQALKYLILQVSRY